MGICRTADRVRVVSGNEMFIMFIRPDGEHTAINISEWHKIM
jgi:hypothetical protein